MNELNMKMSTAIMGKLEILKNRLRILESEEGVKTASQLKFKQESAEILLSQCGNLIRCLETAMETLEKISDYHDDECLASIEGRKYLCKCRKRDAEQATQQINFLLEL